MFKLAMTSRMTNIRLFSVKSRWRRSLEAMSRSRYASSFTSLASEMSMTIFLVELARSLKRCAP